MYSVCTSSVANNLITETASERWEEISDFERTIQLGTGTFLLYSLRRLLIHIPASPIVMHAQQPSVANNILACNNAIDSPSSTRKKNCALHERNANRFVPRSEALPLLSPTLVSPILRSTSSERPSRDYFYCSLSFSCLFIRFFYLNSLLVRAGSLMQKAQ